MSRPQQSPAGPNPGTHGAGPECCQRVTPDGPAASRPKNKVALRDDSLRLRELLTEISALNTTDPLKQLEAGTRVWSYARSIAQEIGVPFQNPPAPKVCRTTGGSCACGGKCL